jgi:hypothetical protein
VFAWDRDKFSHAVTARDRRSSRWCRFPGAVEPDRTRRK